MVVPVWLIAVDGGDRIYTSTKPPSYKPGPNDKIFLVEVTLPGFTEVDGTVRAVAIPAELPQIAVAEKGGVV